MERFWQDKCCSNSEPFFWNMLIWPSHNFSFFLSGSGGWCCDTAGETYRLSFDAVKCSVRKIASKGMDQKQCIPIRQAIWHHVWEKDVKIQGKNSVWKQLHYVCPLHDGADFLICFRTNSRVTTPIKNSLWTETFIDISFHPCVFSAVCNSSLYAVMKPTDIWDKSFSVKVMQHPGCGITINMHFLGQVWTSRNGSERDSVILLSKHKFLPQTVVIRFWSAQ